MKLGNADLAEKHYLAAIAIDGLFYSARTNLAFLYYRTGRIAEAEQQFREILEAYPENYDVAYNLGVLRSDRYRVEEAAAYISLARAILNLDEFIMRE